MSLKVYFLPNWEAEAWKISLNEMNLLTSDLTQSANQNIMYAWNMTKIIPGVRIDEGECETPLNK